MNDILFGSMSLGQEAEAEIGNAIRSQFKRVGKLHLYHDVTGTVLDKYQGTDAVLGKMRVDYTVNFSHKNYIDRKFSIPSIKLGNTVVKFAIRLGNSHAKFQVPVMVVGCDMPSNMSREDKDAMINDLCTNPDSIIRHMERYYRMYTSR